MTVLNWLGTAAYQLHDEFDYTGKDKDKLPDVLDRFETYFRPQHNMIHPWYRIGTTFSDSSEIKTQSDFMYRLKDLAKHSEVKQELLKCVTRDTTLSQCLEYACNIEGNLQSVKLSKYVEKAQPSVSATEANVHAVDKRMVKPKQRDVTPARQNSGGCDGDEKPKGVGSEEGSLLSWHTPLTQ